MELQHKEIPTEFLRRLPEGIKIVKRHGKEFLVVESVYGPGGEDLVSRSVHIHDEPTLRLGVRIGGGEGLIFVDSYWGSHAKLYSFLPEITGSDTEVDAFVPESGASLMEEKKCDIEGCGCGRAIVLHLPRGEGKVYVCARLGCPGHSLELKDLPSEVVKTVGSINYFGVGSLDESWFDEF
ncbi:MAG: hypothetical protein EA427_03510 [Spirochaetaceae bacterium]|nr:MAG: hypothetical protein EA427_03510 [Spirochaetaceae bacterium]